VIPVAYASSRRFQKARRLRRRSEFQRVFDSGQRARGRFFTLLAAPRPAGGARLGIVASKKLGNAVRRNRAKRLIRNIFRHSDIHAAGIDVVVIPRIELFTASYAAIEEDYRTVLRRCASRLGQPRQP
jgi:ribonuclease P protein component